jgi:membrane dipeptidase
MIWFDAHLDLACLALNKRDMLTPLPDDTTGIGPFAPASVTLPELAAGNVRFALATVFTEPDGDDAVAYPVGDAERAHAIGRAQIEAYTTWRDMGLVSIDLPACLRRDPGVGDIRGGMGVSTVVPLPLEKRITRLAPSLHIGILIEGADPVRTPDELSWWKRRGACAVGLTWARMSRYAGGNTTTEGITDLGRALVREIDRLGLVHDVSHLSDRAFFELLDLSDGRIIASHSNCRAIVDPSGTNQRHLTDDQVRAIVRRGGVIGLNLFSRFLRPAGREGRATIAEAVAHVERVCDIAGSRRHIGLGSDADGGFSAAALPEGIDRPRDLANLAGALASRGWSEDDVAGFAWKNWARFWAETVPR